MKKLILSAVLLFVCTFSFAQEAEVSQSVEPEDKTETSLMKMYNSSVGIFSIGSAGMGFCSGVVIKNESTSALILTAKHCIGEYEEVYVDNVRVIHQIVSFDDDLALMITKGSIKDKVPVVFASKNAGWRETVFDFGFPKAIPYATVGTVYLNSIDHQYYLLKVIPGCSGGGLFNEDGELIAIVWGGLGDNIAISEPLSDIIRFLKINGVL